MEIVELCEKGGRTNPASRAHQEVWIISECLCKQLSRGEAEEIVLRIGTEFGADPAKSFRTVIPLARRELDGRTEMNSSKEL